MAIPHWHVQGFSPQSRRDQVQLPRAQRVFKSYNSLVCARTLSSKSKISSPITPRTTVFKCHTSLTCVGALSSKSKNRVRSPSRATSPQVSCPLAYAEALSSKSKDRVRLSPCTTSIQASYLADMCGGSLLKVERPSPITPMYNESSSVMSRWHIRRLSPQSLKTESNCHRAQRVFKRHTSLTCVGTLSSKSKD